MANIKSNNYRKIDCRLYNDEYMDFMLSKEDKFSAGLDQDCLSASLDFGEMADGRTIVSKHSWTDSTTSDDTLYNIGITGVDNGFIKYDRDRIGNDEFLELFTGSTFDLSTYGDRFFVTEVGGNTMLYKYPLEKMEGYTAFKGGFYQGFFKTPGSDYQTLPHLIKNQWNFSFTLRRRDYETHANTLNKRYPDNAGIFFYIGTRAENKFWELYKKNEEYEKYNEKDSLDYSVNFDIEDPDVLKHQFLEDDYYPADLDDQYGNSCDCMNCDEYFADGDFDPYGEKVGSVVSENGVETVVLTGSYSEAGFGNFFYDHGTGQYDCTCVDSRVNTIYKETQQTGGNTGCNTDYFLDEYTGAGNTTCDCPEDGAVIDGDYIAEQISLADLRLKDSQGNDFDRFGQYYIPTANKFVIFNRTKDGFTTQTWNDEYNFELSGITEAPNINYFPYLNRTPTGYTVDNIDKLIEQHRYSYDIFKDIRNNTFALKINSDGSIGYKYGMLDCDAENSYSVMEEKSKPGLIPLDEWVKIHVRIARIPGAQEDICDSMYIYNKMRIYIYVNGFLKFVSGELPELELRELNDVPGKQEGVPFNISIGGGTQGLTERVMLDYYNMTDYTLPIERDFAGTFIGDIKDFSFYSCPVDYEDILAQGSSF